MNRDELDRLIKGLEHLRDTSTNPIEVASAIKELEALNEAAQFGREAADRVDAELKDQLTTTLGNIETLRKKR